MRNKRRVIKVGAGLLSLCIAAWSIPPLIEKMEAVKSGDLSGVPGLGIISGGADGTTLGSDEPTLITPSGKSVTDEERARLMKQARSMAPLPLDGSARTQTSRGGRQNSRGKDAGSASSKENNKRRKRMERLLEEGPSQKQIERIREQMTGGEG